MERSDTPGTRHGIPQPEGLLVVHARERRTSRAPLQGAESRRDRPGVALLADSSLRPPATNGRALRAEERGGCCLHALQRTCRGHPGTCRRRWPTRSPHAATRRSTAPRAFVARPRKSEFGTARTPVGASAPRFRATLAGSIRPIVPTIGAIVGTIGVNVPGFGAIVPRIGAIVEGFRAPVGRFRANAGTSRVEAGTIGGIGRRTSVTEPTVEPHRAAGRLRRVSRVVMT